MAKIQLIHGDAAVVRTESDLILTDPPYDMPGARLAQILRQHEADHLVLLCTMRQLLEFIAAGGGWKLAFDFVLDNVAPRQSRSIHQPNYTHSTGVYLTKSASRFNRKLRRRSDVFKEGYWPTVIRAPREHASVSGMAKNAAAVTDILGSFEVRTVCDPFAGAGTTGIAAHELGIDATLIEIDSEQVNATMALLQMIGADVHEP